MGLRMTGCTFSGNAVVFSGSADKVVTGDVDRSKKTETLTEKFLINGIEYYASKGESFTLENGLAFWS